MPTLASLFVGASIALMVAWIICFIVMTTLALRACWAIEQFITQYELDDPDPGEEIPEVRPSNVIDLRGKVA